MDGSTTISSEVDRLVETLLNPTSSTTLQNGTRVMFCDIDAAKAQALLARLHPDQRKKRPTHVARIATALTNDKFHWTGAPICLDPRGQVIDGQHRLAAVVASGVAIREMAVMLMADDSAMLHIDTETVARSGSDGLRMATGLSVGSSVFSAVVFEFLNFDVTERVGWTKADQAQVVRECKFLDELAALRATALAAKLGTPRGALAAALRCLKLSRDDAMAFFGAALRNDHFVDGRQWDALRVLSTAILNTKSKNVSGKEMAGKCIRAWNAYRSGNDIKALKFTGSVPVAL